MNSKSQNFGKRLKSMQSVDLRRMFTSPLFYIMVGISLVMPVLILVMTSAMAGTTTVDPNTGVETTIQGFSSVWQIISSESGSSMGMDMTAMCNMNLVYIMAAIFVCLFVGEDFRSGYSKNLFTVRSTKAEYVISKTITCFIAGASMILAFFVGSMLGGGIAGMSFDLGSLNAFNIVMCLLSKLFLVLVFVSIPLIAAVFAKQRTWLSILLALGAGMLLFMMIPMMTPLNAGFMNLILCLVGGAIFAGGMGAISTTILKHIDLA